VQYAGSPASNQIITVTASNACGTSAARILNQITISFCSRLSATEESSINVYPNPAHDRIMITLPDDLKGNAMVTLTDAAGRVVLTSSHSIESSKSLEMELQSMKQGVYLLSVQTSDKNYRSKLIIE